MQGFSRAAVAAVIAIAAAPAAHAAPRADLTVSRLTEPPASAVAGATLRVTDTVRNAGRTRSRAFRVGFWLSKDRRRGRGDVAIGRRTQKALKGRRSARRATTLRLPAALAAGSYHVVACADTARKVRERSERNNCRASRRKVSVRPAVFAVPPAQPLPAPGAQPQPQPQPQPAPEPSPAPQPDAGAGWTRQDPDPLSVTHTLQSARAVTQTVSPAIPATITATAEDGTVYTLEIPAKALVSATEITLTPVAAVNGSPLGGLLGAVEILPHGLELLQPAKLTIAPAGDAGPIAGQTGFLSHEQGEDFHLYPLNPDGSLSMHLTHFSTPGVAQATPAERQVVLGQPPERYRAQYEQRMEALIREARAAAEAGDESPLPADEIATLLRGFYDDVVWPQVEQALTDDTVAAQAIAQLLSWSRQVQLLSLEEHPLLKVRHDAVWEYLRMIMENAVKKGWERCVNDHDLDYIVRLVGLARQGQLLGMTFGDEAWDKAQRCANFELDFSSRIEQHYTIEGDTQDHQTDAVWDVQMLDVPIDITGLSQNNTLGWKAFSYQHTVTYPCSEPGKQLTYLTTGTTTRPDTSVLVLLGMDLNSREPGTPPPPDRDITVRISGYQDIGESYQRTATSWCGETKPDDSTDDREEWRSHYDHFHLDEFLTGIQDWDLGSGDLIATKSYNRSTPNASGGLSEVTTLSLWHKPLK